MNFTPKSTALILLILFPFLSNGQQVIPLWENGPPGFENRSREPELAKD